MSVHIVPPDRNLPQEAGERAAFAHAVINGLAQNAKSLPCRYFYDARGSALFEDITRLPEYYPTRTETAILTDHAAQLGAGSDGAVLIEFGSGSSIKTELLLAKMPNLAAYVPLDVSESALAEATERLSRRFAHLRILPNVADFDTGPTLPPDLLNAPRIGFFPGSTIGNFEPAEARALLARMRSILGQQSRLIVGADLVKDARTLVAAYDDATGVTAAFNLNLLARINRELGCNFDLDAFAHEAIYDPVRARIEMRLISTCAQIVTLDGEGFYRPRFFAFQRGERIHTENSHKFTLQGFQKLAEASGWQVNSLLSDANAWFGVFELVPARTV